jgi:hypothetical protein
MTLAVSMVMLREDIRLSVATIQQELATNWPDLPAITSSDEGERNDSLTFNVGSSAIILGKMPAPIPWSELEGPCATSILWRDAAQDVRQHKIHWIVTVSGDLDPIPLAMLLTQVTAAVMATCPAVLGVYWGNATLVIPKQLFVDFAKEVLPQGPPLHMWVDFRVGRSTANSSFGFTTGMAALGHLEFETEQWPELPDQLYERLFALASYVVKNGPMLRDGNTVGANADERIRVVYAPSIFGHDGQVIRLEHAKSLA